MDYKKIYIEEVKIFNDISNKFDNLVEEDIACLLYTSRCV